VGDWQRRPPAVRIWTTSDYGLNWDRGGLLSLGGDILAGPASFAPDPGSTLGWSGWLVIDTASYAQRVAATNGGPLSLLPAAVPAGTVQLISPGTGLAWSLNYPSNPSVAVLTPARTSDNGQRWQQSGTRLLVPASSLAGAAARFHRRPPRLARTGQRHLAHRRRRPHLDPRLAARS
jgi:hypothetical protein